MPAAGGDHRDSLLEVYGVEVDVLTLDRDGRSVQVCVPPLGPRAG